MKIKNILSAWASTTLGALIGVTTTVVSSLNSGHFSWEGLGAGVLVAVIMGLTDAFKEAKNEIDKK